MRAGRNTQKYLFALFALFVIFADELFYGFVSISGMGLQSGMKSREAIFIAGISYWLLFRDMFGNRLRRRNYWQLAALLVLLVLYFLTHFFFPEDGVLSNYWAHFLVFGALCIPACYVGLRLARGQYDQQILKMLPLFVIVVSFVVAVAVVTTSIAGAILNNDDDVFNYQSATYYLSYCFSYSFFYVFLYKKKGKGRFSKWENLGMLTVLFVCAIACLLGGGRGGLVYLVLISTFMIFRLLKQKGRVKAGTIILLILAAAVMAVLVIKLNVLESSGFSRVANHFTQDDNRMGLWSKAIQGFYDSPILGHGLGSVWWVVGFYSHNILTDFLVETGIVGMLILVIIIFRIFLVLYKRSKYSYFDMFMLLVFLGAMMEITFSGYWISAPKLFLAFGYVYGLSPHVKKRIKGNKKRNNKECKRLELPLSA